VRFNEPGFVIGPSSGSVLMGSPAQAGRAARSSADLAEPVPERFAANRDAVLILVDPGTLVVRGLGMGPQQSIVGLAAGAVATAMVLQEPVIDSPRHRPMPRLARTESSGC
jgi:hypothetical protein